MTAPQAKTSPSPPGAWLQYRFLNPAPSIAFNECLEQGYFGFILVEWEDVQIAALYVCVRSVK